MTTDYFEALGFYSDENAEDSSIDADEATSNPAWTGSYTTVPSFHLLDQWNNWYDITTTFKTSAVASATVATDLTDALTSVLTIVNDNLGSSLWKPIREIFVSSTSESTPEHTQGNHPAKLAIDISRINKIPL